MAHSISIDWSLLPAVLGVAETGSLSAAARALGLSQPTLGRQIRAAEEAIGMPLFTRHARGFSPTEACERLLPNLREMREAARKLDVIAAGQDASLSGRVRITASVFVATLILPPVMAQIRADHPQIDLDLVASDASENLLFHEADIAIRMYRPTQLDMVTRHLGDLQMGLYATTEYLDRNGRPASVSDIEGHSFIGYDRDERILNGMRQLGLKVDRDWFALRTDDQVAYWQLVCAGCGIGVGQRIVGDGDARVERILPDQPLPVLPVWLTAHQALRPTPRIAAVWSALDRALSAMVT